MDKKRKNITILSNTQLIIGSTIIFALMIIFFDTNNIRYKKSLNKKLEVQTAVRDSLLRQIEKDSIVTTRIKHDDAYLEKYARENFFMQREGEDLFVIETSK